MFELIDSLTGDAWRLILASLVVLMAGRLGSRIVGEKTLHQLFPRVAAAIEVVLDPLMVVLVGSLLRIANAILGVPVLDAPIRMLTALIAYLALAWALGRLAESWLNPRDGEKQAGRVRMPKLLTGLIYIVFTALALALFSREQGYSFAGVWVSTGVAAAVLGLALQSTLADLFSGIALGVERPFAIDDWIELDDGTLGQVVDMNWRATHLRGWDNTTHVVPNGKLARATIKNLHGSRHLFAPWYFVKLPAEVDPRFATALLLEAAMRCETVLRFPNPVVRLADAGGPPYSYMVWVHFPNYPSMFRGREELFREIHRSLKKAGLAVAPEITEMRTRRAEAVNAEVPTAALALRALEVSGMLSDQELDQLAQRSEYRYFNAGQVLLAEGSRSDAFYVIAGGLVDSNIRLPDGSRKQVETLGPGSQFGFETMLSSEVNYLELVARTDVTLIRVDIECMRALAGSRPDLSERLAALVKERISLAEAARTQSRQATIRPSLRELRNRIERRLLRPRGR